MNNKRHSQQVALERIFEYLLSSGRRDLAEGFFNYCTISQKYCDARKIWKCCKCNKLIPIGTNYFNKSISSNNFSLTLKYCSECSLESFSKKEVKQTKMKFFVQEEQL